MTEPIAADSHDLGHCHIRVSAAIRRAPDVVLVVRESHRGEERLTLPGGAPQIGESLERAVVREVFEETGYRILPSQIAYVGEFHVEKWAEPALEICFYASVIDNDSDGPRHGEHIRSIDWRSLTDPALLSALPELTGLASSRKGEYLVIRRGFNA